MALNDITFQDGDNQNFICEIPLDTLHAPIDILFDTSKDYVDKTPIGSLNSPLDWLVGNRTSSEVLMSKLVLTSSGGEISYAYIG